MDRYDVIIVGARVAGASTALLLARAGHRVLVLDRARRGSDTLSTHALMRPGVIQLDRWGVLDDVIAAGTPGQDQVVFHYGERRIQLPVAETLYAPRRWLLDGLLVSAAEAAGAEFRFGVDVRRVLRSVDGVTGVVIRDPRGVEQELGAWMTVGADGRRSVVADAVAPGVTRQGTATSASAYAYVTGVDSAGYEWCYGPRATGGLIPTNEDQTCVFVSLPPDRFSPEVRSGAGLLRMLAEASTDVAHRAATGRVVGPVRGFLGMRGWLRRPWGPGWALVGDAGYFKDPMTAHGITDALRDAELLADALDVSLSGCAPPGETLREYERVRDRLALPFFELTDRIAGFAWTVESIQELHVSMSAMMQVEAEALEGQRVAT